MEGAYSPKKEFAGSSYEVIDRKAKQAQDVKAREGESSYNESVQQCSRFLLLSQILFLEISYFR